MLSAFHFSVIVLNVYAFCYDQAYLDLPFPSEGYHEMPLRGRYSFLTFWCFVEKQVNRSLYMKQATPQELTGYFTYSQEHSNALVGLGIVIWLRSSTLQTIYFALALLNDFFGTSAATPNKTSIIRSLKDTVFSIAFPMALHVFISFWSIYAVDKELVFPEEISRNFPVWLNHTLHTFIIVFILIELVLTNRNYPSRLLGCGLTALFAISYIIWLHVLYERYGAWVYPFLSVLTLPQRIIYLGVSLLFGTLFYLLGEKLNSLVSVERSKSISNGDKRKRK